MFSHKKNGSWDHVAPVVVIGHRYMGVLRPKHAPPVSIHICVVWDKAPQLRLDAPGSASWSVNFGNWAVRGLQNAMNLVPGEGERERDVIIYIYYTHWHASFPYSIRSNHIFWSFWGYRGIMGYPLFSVTQVRLTEPQKLSQLWGLQCLLGSLLWPR